MRKDLHVNWHVVIELRQIKNTRIIFFTIVWVLSTVSSESITTKNDEKSSSLKYIVYSLDSIESVDSVHTMTLASKDCSRNWGKQV